jgi:hypothetical protein
MISLVKSPPNHYDVLGLTPAAGDGEIAQAFARKMSLFGAHQMAEAAQICAAYEVLRNAQKRRDYDRSIGVGARAEPRQWAFAVSQQQWPGFAGGANAAYAREPQAPVQPGPRPATQPQVERASTIAERLRRLAEPEYDGMAELAPQRPSPAPPPRAVEPAARAPEADIYEILARGGEAARSRDGERQPFEWRRPALVAGGFVAAAGLVGALAGFSVKDDAAAAAVTTPLPAARKVAEARPPVAMAPAAVEPLSAAAPASPPALQHASSRSRFARTVERKLGVMDGAGQAQAIQVAAAEPADETAAAQVVPASMPLPGNVVARTIDRIGYSCGSVASTAAVEGASGVFKVTCSSGETYQATPVHGRYRFRRADR